jgi:hypothetical protein
MMTLPRLISVCVGGRCAEHEQGTRHRCTDQRPNTRAMVRPLSRLALLADTCHSEQSAAPRRAEHSRNRRADGVSDSGREQVLHELRRVRWQGSRLSGAIVFTAFSTTRGRGIGRHGSGGIRSMVRQPAGYAYALMPHTEGGKNNCWQESLAVLVSQSPLKTDPSAPRRYFRHEEGSP